MLKHVFIYAENRLISESKEVLDIIQDPQYRRLKSKVDPDTVLKIFNIDRYIIMDAWSHCGGHGIKSVGRVVFKANRLKQLQTYLCGNNIFNVYQSALPVTSKH